MTTQIYHVFFGYSPRTTWVPHRCWLLRPTGKTLASSDVQTLEEIRGYYQGHFISGPFECGDDFLDFGRPDLETTYRGPSFYGSVKATIL